MSVNFCRKEFQPKISTSTVCADGYGVDNLINFNPFRGGWKGFMAESFIKPPVDIIIEFPINICIEKIVLDPSVGRQKSSGFEIYSATVEQGERKDSKKPEPISTRIGNAFVPWSSASQGTCMVRFINTSYRSRFPDILRLSPQKQDVGGQDDVERFLRMASPGAVVNMNRLTIRISRSYGGSVVALRRVEVWGEPSMRISKERQLWALEIICKLYSKQDTVPQRQKASSSGDRTSSKSSSNSLPLGCHGKSAEDANECPEDFLDPITCQMMILPVLLPSGHTIDRSTLEKHNKTEAVWGRPPNDPFTGVAFTSKSQPVPNVKLKTRIDRYLLTSGDKHKSVARDVGRASTAGNSMGLSASTLVVPNTTQVPASASVRHSKPKSNSKHGNLPVVGYKTTSEQPASTEFTLNGSHQIKPDENLRSRHHHNLPLVNFNSPKSKSYLPSKQKRTADGGVKPSSNNQQPLNKRVKMSISATGGMQQTSSARSAEKTTGRTQQASSVTSEQTAGDNGKGRNIAHVKNDKYACVEKPLMKLRTSRGGRSDMTSSIFSICV